jgi:hypothetical protein
LGHELSLRDSSDNRRSGSADARTQPGPPRSQEGTGSLAASPHLPRIPCRLRLGLNGLRPDAAGLDPNARYKSPAGNGRVKGIAFRQSGGTGRTQFEKLPDAVIADVNGTPLTLGMVADRLHECPEKFSVLPTPVVYKAVLDDLIQ